MSTDRMRNTIALTGFRLVQTAPREFILTIDEHEMAALHMAQALVIRYAPDDRLDLMAVAGAIEDMLVEAEANYRHWR